MNDTLLSSSIFSPSGNDINSMRFSFGGSSTTSFDSVGLDNIRVTNGELFASVPEPAALSLMLMGVAAIRRKNITLYCLISSVFSGGADNDSHAPEIAVTAFLLVLLRQFNPQICWRVSREKVRFGFVLAITFIRLVSMKERIEPVANLSEAK